MTVCPRCRNISMHDSVVLANTDVRVCRACERAWWLAPESRRLRAISLSLFSEWIERERCEEANHGNATTGTDTEPKS